MIGDGIGALVRARSLWGAGGESLLSADLADHGGAVANADSDNIRAYLGRLNERGFAAGSVARRLSAIRQLYRFLYAEGTRKDDPAAAIEGPKRGRALPKIFWSAHDIVLLRHL